MKITLLDAAVAYQAPKHYDVKSLWLTDAAADSDHFCKVGLSYYLPGGSAEMDASPFEKIYVGISGEIVVETAAGDRQVLRAMDSCVIAAGEMRSVRNETNSIATLLVILPKL